MERINITINNKKIETTSGKTILEVVNEHNLDTIPTLCHDDRIEPYGSCFMCVVEVEGMNRFVPACSTPIGNGMVITTNNERIKASRKTALELLLSNHYADCIGPCVNNCPANVDAQGYIALISMGKYEEALKLIKENNPLPLSIGRVCVRDCEQDCRRKEVDEAVSINYLKRFVADYDDVSWIPEIKEEKNEKIAIIGGGPSGLTCAYYLRLKGYRVKIFEKLAKLGGMLRYGIPEYRLPKEILDKEIKWITDLGIEVETGIEMGKDFTIESLKKDGFNSIYLAVGAHKASKMGLNDENNTKGVFGGIEFLRELINEGAPKLKGTVAIVGGGNTAIDAARTAIRCGADNVKLVYRRTIKEMPAHHEEVEAAQHEGVGMLFLNNPKAIVTENNKLKGIECIKMELKDAGEGKRPRPVPIEGSEYILECDYLIGAIGQGIDTGFAIGNKDLSLSDWDTIEVNEETFETSIIGVFAGGDVVTGAYTAISSIGQGKKAAYSIMSYLETGKAVARANKFYSFKHKFAEVPASEFSEFPKVQRNRMVELPVESRITNFDEVELGISEVQSNCETGRCLECGCSEYNDCTLRKYADDFSIDIKNYIGETRKYKVDKRHPFITIDSNKCINCGKCVRTCSEILKVSALGFVHRGFNSIVKPAMEKALSDTNCIACGNCIDICPTGALTEKFPFKVLGNLEKENHESICNFCSLGCKVNFKTINDDIYYVSNDTESVKDSLNKGFLCVKGRFGHRYLQNQDKILTPIIRNENGTNEINLDEATKYASDRIKEISIKYGPESIAVFGSPKLTNEELYLLQKLGRDAIGTNNVHSFHNMLNDCSQDELDEILGVTTSTATMEDIQNADVIVALNSNLNEENLIMELNIKKAQKKGKKLIVINSSEIKLTKYADLWIDSHKGSNTVLLSGIINEIIDSKNFNDQHIKNYTEEFTKLKGMVSIYDKDEVISITKINSEKYDELLSLLNNPKSNIVFVYNIDSSKEKSNNDLKAVGNFLVLTDRVQKAGNGIFFLRDFANSAGLLDMGMHPNYKPGLLPTKKETNILDSLINGKIKAALIFSEDPLSDKDNYKLLNNLEFLLVSDSFNTDTVKAANLVIPALTYAQKQGTYTSGDNKVQKISSFVSKNNIQESREIINQIAKNIGENFAYTTNEDIFAEIQKVNRFYSKISIEDHWSKNIFKDGCLIDNKKAKFATFSIDISVKSSEKKNVLYSENYYKTRIKGKMSL